MLLSGSAPIVVLGSVFLLFALIAAWAIWHQRRRLVRGLAKGRVPADSVFCSTNPNGDRHDLPRGSYLQARYATKLDEVKDSECPVCLKAPKPRRKAWTIFACGHCVCTSCFVALAQTQYDAAACPICRRPLLRRGDEQEAAEAAQEAAHAAAEAGQHEAAAGTGQHEAAADTGQHGAAEQEETGAAEQEETGAKEEAERRQANR